MRRTLYPLLERLLQHVEDWAQRARWRVAICPDCGRNRYTGAPCK